MGSSYHWDGWMGRGEGDVTLGRGAPETFKKMHEPVIELQEKWGRGHSKDRLGMLVPFLDVGLKTLDVIEPPFCSDGLWMFATGVSANIKRGHPERYRIGIPILTCCALLGRRTLRIIWLRRKTLK